MPVRIPNLSCLDDPRTNSQCPVRLDLVAEMATVSSELFREKLSEMDSTVMHEFDMRQEDFAYCCRFLSQVGYIVWDEEAKEMLQSKEEYTRADFEYYKPDDGHGAICIMEYSVEGLVFRFKIFESVEHIELGDQYLMDVNLGDLTIPLYCLSDFTNYTEGEWIGLFGRYCYDDGATLSVSVSYDPKKKDITDINFDQFYISYDMCGHYPPELTEQ